MSSNTSKKTGGGIFRRWHIIIKVFSLFFAVFPYKVNLFIFNRIQSLQGNLGIFFRYVLIKNLAASCGENVVIKENVYLFHISKLSIGNNVSIHPMCYIDCIGNVSIGNNVSIAHATTILSSSHTYSDPNIPIKYNECIVASTTIENDVWIGCGARIIYGTTIATRCIIGAGSIVNKNTQANSLYAGVPARKIKNI